MVVGVCLGLLVHFRDRWNRQGRLAKGLAASAYTVYLIHPLHHARTGPWGTTERIVMRVCYQG